MSAPIKYIGIYVVMAISAMTTYAQIPERSDTLRINTDSLNLYDRSHEFETPDMSSGMPWRYTNPSLTAPLDFQWAPADIYNRTDISGSTNSLINFQIPAVSFYPGVANIGIWKTGAFFANGSRAYYPGLAGVEKGALNLSQNFGPLNITASAGAAKFGYFRGLTTQWSFGGSMTYSFSERLSLTLFGNYYTRTRIPHPGIREMAGVPSLGGYLNWRFAEHWGIKAGASTQQNIFTNAWETRPIVMPYFRTSSGAELGVDVGGILYEVFRSKSGHSYGNPTMGPIKPGPPPVGPRN